MVGDLKSKLEQIVQGNAELREELAAAIGSLEPQAKAKAPNRGILRAGLTAALEILNRATSNALVAELQDRIAAVLSWLDA